MTKTRDVHICFNRTENGWVARVKTKPLDSELAGQVEAAAKEGRLQEWFMEANRQAAGKEYQAATLVELFDIIVKLDIEGVGAADIERSVRESFGERS